MKKITLLFICASVLLVTACFADDLVRGQITGNLDKKVKIMLGDKAITNLGKKDALIKGDVLDIYTTEDVKFIDPIGRCAVVLVRDSMSVCEIIKMKREIGADIVTIQKMEFNDPNLLGPIYQLLTKTVDPYEPQKEITVYVHNIVDEQNSVTEFSEMVRKEIKKIFFQKKRIKPVTKTVSQSLLAYLPGEFSESHQMIEEYMKRDNIDVIISGEYRLKGDKIELTLFKVDKNWKDITLETLVDRAKYEGSLAKVVVPFSPMKKEQTVACSIIYKPTHYKAAIRDERSDIIEYESKSNPFLEYNLKRIDFNIISPVDFALKIDDSSISFAKTTKYELRLPTGKHEITASFKKGYFLNDTLMVTNENVVQKNIVLFMDKPEDIVIEVAANPVAGRESIDFNIYKKAEKMEPVLMPVVEKKTVKPVETFKD
jgi:hypothetical protein